MSTFLYELGRWSFRHHARVVLGWVLAVLIAGGAALAIGDGTRNEFEIPGTESNDAMQGLERTFPDLAGLTAYVVVVAPDGTSIRGEQPRALIEDMVAAIEDVEGVRGATSPYDDLVSDVALSGDDEAAQVQIQLSGGYADITEDFKSELVATGDRLEQADYTVAFGGDAFANMGPKLSIVEIIGVIVAFIVLYRMFRSLRAAFMPIFTALVGVIVSMELIWAATGLLTVSATAPLIALMIGLAVGIDYALFILSRHRELLAEGVAPEEAAARSVATAGSAVVFAGVTVMIALTGLAVARIPFLTVMGVAGALAVAIAVAVALTLLPALLGRAGERLRPSEKERAPGGFSRRWVRWTTRFPSIAMVLVVGLLAVASIPVKDLTLALPDNGDEPQGSSQRVAYDLVDEQFGPGFNGPLLVTMDIITSTDPVGVVEAVEDDLRQVEGVAEIGLATPNPTADTAVVQVIPSTAPDDPQTAELVERLRELAPTWEDEHGVEVSVTGLTAAGIDVSDRLLSALLPFGVLVVGLSVLLLMVVFRSVLVPVKATLGFVLSTGAAFGAVVAAFQWGWFSQVTLLEQTGPVLSFLPILLMAEDSIEFPVEGEGIEAGDQVSAIPPWERWHDYAIGLFRAAETRGVKGPLRQAEEAFAEVARLAPGRGSLGMARVAIRDGRIEDAAASLRQAAESDPPAYPWSLAWFSAEVDRELGRFGSAIDRLRRLVRSDFAEAQRRGFDFSRDDRLLVRLADTLLLQAISLPPGAERESLLAEARDRCNEALRLDSQRAESWYVLAQVEEARGEADAAAEALRRHAIYKPDDNARDRAVQLARQRYPAANHAAEAIVIYDLQRPGAYGLPASAAEAGEHGSR